jgi:hypothetical protein
MPNDGAEIVWSWLHPAEFQSELQAEGPVLAETSLSIGLSIVSLQPTRYSRSIFSEADTQRWS